MHYWTYKGVTVYRADWNASGIRWYARTGNGTGVLRADTKQGMRSLISAAVKPTTKGK